MAHKYPEIEKILMGNVVRDKYGVLGASPKEQKRKLNLDFKGSYNGASTVRLFGLSIRYQEFSIAGNAKAAADESYRILSEMGAPIHVENLEKSQCVMVWRYMLNPVILAMEPSHKTIRLTAFTARQPFGQIACVRMLQKFYKQMKDILTPEKGEALPDRDGSEERIAARKAEKEKKEAEKQQKKAAAAQKSKPEESAKPAPEPKSNDAEKKEV